MLCDDIIESVGEFDSKVLWAKSEIRRLKALGHDTSEVDGLLTGDTFASKDLLYMKVATAQRFVLSPLIVQAAQDLADAKAIERSRHHLFLPADSTWIEWAPPSGGRVGVLLHGERANFPPDTNGLVLGLTMAYARGAMLGRSSHQEDGFGLYDVRLGMFDFHGTGAPIDLHRDSRNGGSWPNDPAYWESFGRFVCAVIALINTPRVVALEKFEHQKLNHHRARHNRPALLSWTQVTISPDVWVGKTQQLGRTEQRAFHHVRAHLRLRLGRVQIVRPHWRGDPRYGVRLHRYCVRRIEDERGLWEGGVLPMPSVLQ